MKASFAERLREAINMRGFTQTELCEKTQISQSAMSQYLSGTHEARQSKIHRMAKALNVNPAWLMGYVVDPDTQDSFVRADILNPFDIELLRRFYGASDERKDMVCDLLRVPKSSKRPNEPEGYITTLQDWEHSE